MSKNKIKIAGAGVSGLISAIKLKDAGYNVVVYDKASDSGERFSNDFQGIENWVYKQDVLDFLEELNIDTDFYYMEGNEMEIWTSENKCNEIEFKRPLFYLIKRGTEENCLDQALKKQALSRGIEIKYNHPVEPEEVDIVATGPLLKDSDIDGLVAGYTFDTNLEDSCIMIMDDEYAYNGYSYFLVSEGKATLASCIFGNYEKANEYREKTLKFYKERIDFEMENIEEFSGTGNFFLPEIPDDKKIYIGEAGGFQDYLWGFGIRYAIKSGYYAAQSIIENEDFYKLCEEDIYPKMRNSVTNRMLYMIFNNNIYSWLIRVHDLIIKDKIKYARKIYQSSWYKRFLFFFSKRALGDNIKDPRDL